MQEVRWTSRIWTVSTVLERRLLFWTAYRTTGLGRSATSQTDPKAGVRPGRKTRTGDF